MLRSCQDPALVELCPAQPQLVLHLLSIYISGVFVRLEQVWNTCWRVSICGLTSPEILVIYIWLVIQWSHKIFHLGSIFMFCVRSLELECFDKRIEFRRTVLTFLDRNPTCWQKYAQHGPTLRNLEKDIWYNVFAPPINEPIRISNILNILLVPLL